MQPVGRYVDITILLDLSQLLQFSNHFHSKCEFAVVIFGLVRNIS